MPVAIANAVAPALTEGRVQPLSMDLAGNVRVLATFSGAIGAVDQGSPNTLANGWPVKVTDGTDLLLINAAGEAETEIARWIGSTAPTVGQKAMASSLPVAIASDQVTFANVYSLGIGIVGTATAPFNFLSLFNGGAGVAVLLACFYEDYSNAVATTNTERKLHRITAATGGTLFPAAGISKFDTGSPNPTLAVRFNGPAVTRSPAEPVMEFAPNHAITAVGATSPSQRSFIPDPMRWGRFYLRASEGVVIWQNSAGDADERLVMTLVWAEL
ncbi:MAG: hypothetical protein ACREIS_13225 [Nitrospiraceae bacterium]